MKTARRVSTVMVLVCLICNAVSFGEGTDKAKTELKFEISTGIYDLKSARRPALRRVTDKSKMIKPTHVAIMDFGDNIFFKSSTEPDAILDTTSGKKMSDLQKEFVKQGDAIVPYVIKSSKLSTLYEVDEFGNRKDVRIHVIGRICLFAVSENDAKKMAAAFLESWDIRKGAEVQKILEKKKGFEKKAVELRQHCTEKNKEFDEMWSEMSNLYLESTILHNPNVFAFKKRQFLLKWSYRLAKTREIKQLRAERKQEYNEGEQELLEQRLRRLPTEALEVLELVYNKGIKDGGVNTNRF